MSYSRTRTLDSYDTSRTGRYYHPILRTWTTRTSQGRIRRTTLDVVGNRTGPNPFTSEEGGVCQIIMNGTYNGYIFDNFPTYAGDHPAPTHDTRIQIVPSSAELNQFGMDIVAKTNPNAPSVSIPTAIGELKELPSLIRSSGIKHLTRVSEYRSGRPFKEMYDQAIGRFFGRSNKVNGVVLDKKFLPEKYLEYRWGIAPMISDVAKLIKFTEAVERRVKWFEKLGRGESIHRRCRLGTDAAYSNNNGGAIWSIGAGVGTSRIAKVTKSETWGSAQWRCSNPYRFPSTPAQQRKAAWQAVSGMSPQALSLAAWELMPWSWLIDWFTNFGALFGAIQNTVPVQHSNLCVMRRITTHEWAVPTTAAAGIKLTGTWHRWLITKRRWVVTNPNPVTISFAPLVEGDKLSILGSLAVLRGARFR